MKNVKVFIYLQIFFVIVIIVAVCAYINMRGVGARGRVNGIIYAMEDSSALIDDQVLKEGDVVADEVRVLKINKDTVEFIKNGQVWTQGIGQRPNRLWKEPDQQ